MNELMYICRGMVNTENAINRLNKRVINLTKCCRMTNARVTCGVIAGLLIMTVVAIQDKEITELRKQVADLKTKVEADDTTEEHNDQEGA